MEFRELPLFLHWSNTSLLRIINEVAGLSCEALPLLGHILATEHIWLGRLQGEVSFLETWPELTATDCYQLINANVTGFRHFLARPAVEELIHYLDNDGKSCSHRTKDIVLHVLAHGTYNRGQIASLLRKNGISFAPLDYLTFIKDNLHCPISD